MTIKIHSREMLATQKPTRSFKPGFRLSDHVREVRDVSGKIVHEFVGMGDFGDAWQERQRYEVFAGRDEEPILYTPIYQEIRDRNLPRNVAVNRLGPAGVVLEQIFEGGEIKFASVGSSDFSVPIVHYGVGLEYSKDLVEFNELWRVPLVERQVGIAYNALLNHLHLNPILAYAYAAANQTAANSSGVTTVEDYMLTIEDAITNSMTDTDNPRRGPYAILCSAANLFTIEKALTRVPQEGVSLQSRAIDMVRSVIAYDGWTGTRGSKSTTYSGVSSGTAYLISLQYQGYDFQSYMKQDLLQEGEQQDISRLLTQTVWDTYFGVYANPVGAVEEITLP